MEFFCNTQLHASEKQYMIQRFPKDIKLSYETVAHKKVSSDYNLCIAIPYGRKAYLWWTYYKKNTVCCLLELNRASVIGENVSFVNIPCPRDFETGTIVSGIVVDDSESEPENKKTFQHFLVDDIYMFKGHVMHKFQPQAFAEKIGYIHEFFRLLRPLELPEHGIFVDYYHFWERKVDMDDESIPETCKVPYNIRYIQYRNTQDVCPHINVSIHKKPIWNPVIVADDVWSQVEKPCVPNWTLDIYKPHYKQSCLFWVRADIAYDVYYLYAKDPQRKPALYQYEFIPNYRTSVMMNGIFRSIKENENIDYIEESDDEDVYEDIRRDKFVDLQKMVLMECVFDRKFRKWTPIREQTTRHLEKHIPYINQLVTMKNGHKPNHKHMRPGHRTNNTYKPYQNKMVR